MQDGKDVFAEIAGKRLQQRRRELTEPQPSKLTAVNLPVQSGRKHAFIPPAKIDSNETLKKDVQTLCDRYRPFLQNLAPKPLDYRCRRSLGSFDWRIETETDRREFQRVLLGKGSWQRVIIPHYGPPTGRASTLYRCVFRLDENMLDADALFIHFNGVDYKAHVFINSAFVGSHEGFFAPFEFNITPYIQPGENCLVVKVENDFIFMGNRTETDARNFQGDKLYAATGCGWDDADFGWHHCPPGMGIYQDLYIEGRSRLFIDDVFVRPMPQKQEVLAYVSVHNGDISYDQISLEFSLYGENFNQCVFKDYLYEPQGVHVPGLGDVIKETDSHPILQAGPGDNQFIVALPLSDMRLWQPQTPWMYQLQVTLLDQTSQPLDTKTQSFGMRSVEMESEEKPRGRFYLNGSPLKLRGVNTMGHLQQCVLRNDYKQLIDDILLAKLCHVNFLRFTQRPVQTEIYEVCDRLGMMTQTDLPLFGVVRRSRFCEVIRQTEEMEKLIRCHPCNILISLINEPFPNAMDKPHRHLTRPELQNFFRAADIAVHQVNPDRIIKAADGDYDPPAPGLPDNHCYCGWYIGHGIDLGKLHKGYWQRVKPGWLYGCGEYGSEGLDSEEVMRNHYPKAWLPQSLSAEREWTPDKIVKAQTGWFHYMWFETPKNLQEWIESSQKHQEWITRLMTEAFRRDNRMVSFALHLLIDAFPAGWMKAVMDVDRRPKPAYFAFRDALTPLMANLRCDRRAFWSGETIQLEAWICNDLHAFPDSLKLCYQMQLDGETIACGRSNAVAEPLKSCFQGYLNFTAPGVDGRKRVSIQLALKADEIIHHTRLELDVFENPPTPVLSAHILGGPDGKADRLTRFLGYKALFGSAQPHGLIIIDDYARYRHQKAAIDAAVRHGSLAVFLDLHPGSYRIGEGKIEVQKCGMGPRHFVSRDSGHDMVRGFQPDDFKFWYDAGAGYVTPLLSSVLDAPGWRAILISGNGDWHGNWRPVPAAAELKRGKGMWRICQVNLADHIEGNPVAHLFSHRLFGKDAGQ